MIWTIVGTIDEVAPAPVLCVALYQQFSARGDAGPSTMWYEFGERKEREAGAKGT